MMNLEQRTALSNTEPLFDWGLSPNTAPIVCTALARSVAVALRSSGFKIYVMNSLLINKLGKNARCRTRELTVQY